jgi:hypothetical protein
MTSTRKQAGIGYMDLIASVLIVMLGAVSMGKLMTYTAGNAGQSKARAEALALAEAKLEALRQFATESEYATSIASSTAAETHVGTNATFAVTWTVSENTAPAFKTATANVAWTDARGNQSVTLSSNVGYDIPVQSGLLLASNAGLLPGMTPPAPGEQLESYPEGEQPSEPVGDTGGEGDQSPDLNDGPYLTPYTISIAGSVSVGNGVQFQGVSGSGNYDVSCSHSASSYECMIADIDQGDTWEGSITVATDKVVCEGATTNYSMISENQEKNYTLRRNSAQC